MAKPHEKLAASLARLEEMQKGGRRIYRSNELTRVHRERLIQNGFLHEVIRGWLMLSSPGSDPGDTMPWYSSFWEFCARYCTSRFGKQWHVSPEQSLLLHAEQTAIPRQIVIYTPNGANNAMALPFGTSLYDLKQKRMPPRSDLSEREGIRLFTPAAALARVPKAFFSRAPVEARVALVGIHDLSGLSRHLLEGGHTMVAGWLAGAFRRVGQPESADQILRPMKAAGYDVRENDPFTSRQEFGVLHRPETPIEGRLRALWETCRESVVGEFPKAPGLPGDREAYMRAVDDLYRSDAYHSLSIEGYRVTPDLIERVRSGNWSPEILAADRQSRDTLAARGYWQAFQRVRQAVEEVFSGGDPGSLARVAHHDWYLELFQPCAVANLIALSDLAGYRNDAVYLRGSRHVPPRWELLRDAMSTLFDLLEEEAEPPVRAVLGHWLFGYVHPYPDGNGRMARFLMNVMLASGGYPWTVIRVEDRTDYLAALEIASVAGDIRPFAGFVAKQVGRLAEQTE